LFPTSGAGGLNQSSMDGDLIAIRQAVSGIHDADNGPQSGEHGGTHPRLPDCCCMRGNAVGTAIRHTDGDINELVCQRIEGAMIASR
jgi:hypothetical protein